MLGILGDVICEGLLSCGQWKSLGAWQTGTCILALLLTDQLSDPGRQIVGLSLCLSVKMRVNLKITYFALLLLLYQLVFSWL